MTAWVSDLHNSQDNRETESREKRGPREGRGESAPKKQDGREEEGPTAPTRFIIIQQISSLGCIGTASYLFCAKINNMAPEATERHKTEHEVPFT